MKSESSFSHGIRESNKSNPGRRFFPRLSIRWTYNTYISTNISTYTSIVL